MAADMRRCRIPGFVELAPPQLLDNRWREFTFDLAEGQNILQDFVNPETGSGYVYRDAKQVGSASHNRFIYWRTVDDIIELIEMSTEVSLEDNQVRIKFINSPVIGDVKVIEMSDVIVLILATISSVHRIYLPHPKLTNRSILSDLTSEVLFSPANYYILGGHNSQVTQHPICATAWYDKSWLKCSLSFPDSSILIVSFAHQTHHITTSTIKQSGIIGRLWSRMPNLWARSPNECDNTIFAAVPLFEPESNDVLLFTLCRDCRLRVFSTTSKECVCSYNMIPQASFHQSFAAHNNPASELPIIRVFQSYIAIHSSDEFIFLSYDYQDGQHELRENLKIPAPGCEKLIDFALTEDKLWALGSNETQTILYYVNRDNLIPESHGDLSMMAECVWDHVDAVDEVCRNIVTDIFWSNRFSLTTIQKALVGVSGPSLPRKSNMEELEELASTRIVDENQAGAWTRFYTYCLQNHQIANKNLGLVAAGDGSLVTIVKRSNPSLICPYLANREHRGPYRGMEELVPEYSELHRALDLISLDLVDDSMSNLFEQKLLDDPSDIMQSVEDIVEVVIEKLDKMTDDKVSQIISPKAALVESGFELFSESLDLTSEAHLFDRKILEKYNTQMRSEHKPLGSNTGIILTFELFKQLVRARMILSRDLIIYLTILREYAVRSKADSKFLDLYDRIETSGKLKRLVDCLRSYGILVWVAETPVKHNTSPIRQDLIKQIASYFEYFKTSRETPSRPLESALETLMQQHLLTNFLASGGINFTWPITDISQDDQTLSNSLYLNETALNLCKLLWPMSSHLCIFEFMYTQQLDEHLSRYLELHQEWLDVSDTDRHFLRALNCMLQNRAQQGVNIFNQLWMRVSCKNLIGRFLELEQDQGCSTDETIIKPDLIYRYYDKLIQLFHSYNNRQSSVMLINQCLSLIDEDADYEHQDRISTLKAKLFQYYLELEESDEAYHTMVLTKDSSLRTNCLRKFIVSHCEKKQWARLLSYPFIDIKDDFIDILNQKAENLDLSELNEQEFHKTSYYDLLFSSYISDEEYKSAAHIMYNYAQRLAQEVPGIISIRKQSDCLLIALNALRCLDEKERFLILPPVISGKIKGGILKRTHDSEPETEVRLQAGDITGTSAENKITCMHIKQRYELTRARLKLLEKDQTANAIALSPLRPEETIAQLVGSSMFSTAFDLALLFGSSMDLILEGLAAKYIMVMNLTSMNLTIHQEIERNLFEIFSNSYSNIDTYNYVANSTSPLTDRLWRLIDYYLVTYDGIGHKYANSKFADTFANSTVLMRAVATKLLHAGCDVPASLRRLYLQRNTAELLKLYIKYDKLLDAADLAIEMFERLRDPSSHFIASSQFAGGKFPPMYLPTHLILLLIEYLREDATKIHLLETAKVIQGKLEHFRIKTCQEFLR